MTSAVEPRLIPEEARRRLRILFMAKHALWGGGLHPEDGNHAIYHHEVRTALEGLGINLTLADRYDVLFEKPAADFVFPLLNRGGFVNSEMLIPLLCNRHGLPYVGAGPIVRGLGDDKHLSKVVCERAGVPTAPWACYRRGAPVEEADCPPAERWVIKPNASLRLAGAFPTRTTGPASPRRSPASTPRAMTRSSSPISAAMTSQVAVHHRSTGR